MIGIFKSRKFWLVAAALVLMAASGPFVSNYAMSQEKDISYGDREATLFNPNMIVGYVGSIKIGILRIQKKLNLDEIPVEKLDFSVPGSPEYGDHPEFEIFNPAGGQILYVTDPASLEYWKTYAEEFRVFFSLGNKVPGLGTEKSELIAIVPHMKKPSCEMINEWMKLKSIPDVERINTTAYPADLLPSELAVLPDTQGCVKTPDGYYYYQVLVER